MDNDQLIEPIANSQGYWLLDDGNAAHVRDGAPGHVPVDDLGVWPNLKTVTLIFARKPLIMLEHGLIQPSTPLLNG
jgi:hypothetical protein